MVTQFARILGELGKLAASLHRFDLVPDVLYWSWWIVREEPLPNQPTGSAITFETPFEWVPSLPESRNSFFLNQIYFDWRNIWTLFYVDLQKIRSYFEDWDDFPSSPLITESQSIAIWKHKNSKIESYPLRLEVQHFQQPRPHAHQQREVRFSSSPSR